MRRLAALLLFLFFDLFQQLVVGIVELLDTIDLQLVGNRVQADANLRQPLERLVRRFDVLSSDGRTLPCSWNFSRVSGGMVFTVSGPISSST